MERELVVSVDPFFPDVVLAQILSQLEIRAQEAYIPGTNKSSATNAQYDAQFGRKSNYRIRNQTFN